MTSEQERKQVESVLSTKSVTVNEGTFMLRINKSSVQYSDFQKQCLFGDAFSSEYSKYISLVPTAVFLPQMFVGKNVLIEERINGGKVPFVDSFLPYAFLIHEKDNALITDMYDRLLPGYSERFSEMQTSLESHYKNCSQKIQFDTDAVEESTSMSELLQESQESFIVVFFTHASSVRFQASAERNLRFGEKDSKQVVNLQNNVPALFDGFTTSPNYNIELSETLTKAIRRELLTLTQIYIGFEKCHDGDIKQYLNNVLSLFKGQHKNVVCEGSNVESYAVASLMLFLSKSLEMDDIHCSSSIVSDPDWEERIKQKILFQNVMILDPGSCFNSRDLAKRDMDRGRSSVVTCGNYTSPFNQLFDAVYENKSWLAHILTTVTFFAKTKKPRSCESCEQVTCAVNAPAVLMGVTAAGRDLKKERTDAVTCFFTSNNFNKTGPVGNLASKESSDLNSTVYWEKHHKELLKILLENYQLDLSLYSDDTTNDKDDMYKRAERMMEVICTHIDNAIAACEQFFNELEEDPENITKTSVEAEIRNMIKMSSMYDKGLANALISESFLYILKGMMLYEKSNLKDMTVNDVFLSMKPLFVDNKSGVAISQHKSLKNILIQKIAIKSYTSDEVTMNVQSKINESYQIEEILSNVSYKTKINLFGKYEELKNNGGRKKQNMFQNISSKKLTTTSCTNNNSFNHFKHFCKRQLASTMALEKNADLSIEEVTSVADEYLDARYSELFAYVNQYKIDSWPHLLLLISVSKLLEHLNWIPSYDRINFLSFNVLNKNPLTRYYEFSQNFVCDDFNQSETVYAMNSSIQGKSLKFKKVAGKYMDRPNKLIQTFANRMMNPGPPIFYFSFGKKSNKMKDGSTVSILTKFINEEQFKLLEDVAYTNYIKKHKKQIYDEIFDEVFSSNGQYIENRYTPEILEEMLDEFDERFPSSIFASENIYEFLKLVISEYFNSDQSNVNLMAKRLKEINTRVKNRKRAREEVPVTASTTGSESDSEGEEYQFLPKRPRL